MCTLMPILFKSFAIVCTLSSNNFICWCCVFSTYDCQFCFISLNDVCPLSMICLNDNEELLFIANECSDAFVLFTSFVLLLIAVVLRLPLFTGPFITVLLILFSSYISIPLTLETESFTPLSFNDVCTPSV